MIDVAVAQVLALGDQVKKESSLLPRLRSRSGPPAIDWVVAPDPRGNEFCLTSELTPGEREAVVDAARSGPADDDTWRSVVRAARTGDAAAPAPPDSAATPVVGVLRR